MADKPIIFSGPMVRALLEGRKTQTRRLLRPQPSKPWGSAFRDGNRWWTGDSLTAEVIEEWALRYAPGDRLYVREAFLRGAAHEGGEMMEAESTYCRADGDPFDSWYDPKTDAYKDRPPWKPSIHMPRWASRLTLIVNDVQVQRLQDISEVDAWAEGCKRGEPWDNRQGYFPAEEPDPSGIGHVGWDFAKEWFEDLWNSLHGPDAWDQNPWVVAVSFTVHRCNIDQMEAAHG